MEMIRRVMFLAVILMLPNFAFAEANIEEIVERIVEYTQSTAVRSICTLIVIGVGIYMAKNHDRLKEVMVMCITILVAIAIIVKADTIANWIFGS